MPESSGTFPSSTTKSSAPAVRKVASKPKFRESRSNRSSVGLSAREYTILREKYNKHEAIHVDEIIDAAKHDDNLSIELIEEVGEKAGKAVAFLINTFNPETVIVGGELAEAGDYLMLPLKSATNKYSLNLVYKDTKFRLSKMGKTASAWGAAMLIRNQVLGLC